MEQKSETVIGVIIAFDYWGRMSGLRDASTSRNQLNRS